MATIPRHLFQKNVASNVWFGLRRGQQRRLKWWRRAKLAIHTRMLALIQKRGPEFFRGGNHPRNANDLELTYWCYRHCLNDLMQEHPWLYQLREKGRALPYRKREWGVWNTPIIPARIRRVEQAKKRHPSGGRTQQ